MLRRMRTALFSHPSIRTQSTSTTSPPLYYEWIGGNGDVSQTRHNQESSSLVVVEESPGITVFLHGLLGNGRNLRTFANQYLQRRGNSSGRHQHPPAQGILVDLPGHGKSKDRRQHVTLPDCLQDLQQTLLDAGIPANDQNWTLVGHSMGGRLALQYVHQGNLYPQPKRLILLDTVPNGPNAGVLRVVGVAEEIRNELQHASKLPSKNQLSKQMAQHMDLSTAQWLANSYDAKTRDFIFDLVVVRDLIREFSDSDFVSKLQEILLRRSRQNNNKSGLERVDLVVGGLNTAWNEARPELQQLEQWAEQKTFPDADVAFYLHTLKNAGHWVHIDDLPGLLDALET